MVNYGDYSLTLIKYFDDINRSLSEINNTITFDALNFPSKIIDNIDNVLKQITSIESTINVLSTSVKVVQKAYIDQLNMLEETRNTLIGKINDRKSTNIQMNSMASMCDDDIVLMDIHVSYENAIEPTINNIYSDMIIDAKDYTCMNIVKKMYEDNSIFADLIAIVKDFFGKMLITIEKIRSSIREIKEILTNTSIFAVLSNNDDNAKKWMHDIDYRISIIYSVTPYKNDVIKLFQTISALQNNYSIYVKAVDAYTSYALENFIGESTFELL